MGSRCVMTAVAFIALFVSLCFFLNAAPQGLKDNDLTLHQITSGSQKKRERRDNGVIYISANSMKTSSSDGADYLTLLEEKAYITVDNNNKTYSISTFQQLQDDARQASNMEGWTTADVSIVEVGPGEAIAGYATKKYHATMNYRIGGTIEMSNEMEIWIAPGFGVPPQFYELNMVSLGNPMMRKIYEEMKKIDGMILRQVETMKEVRGKEVTKTTIVVTSVEKGPIPESTFKVPPSYKKVSTADFWKNLIKRREKP
jgi:hypothetical protein